MAIQTHHQIVIVGGGSAGITVAASLRRHGPAGLDIAIVEPAEKHWYQPAFTLVGGGVTRLADICRDEATLIPQGVTWIRDAVSAFEPGDNALLTAAGSRITYDWLICCPGLELNWDAVAGLRDTLGANGVCSNYSPDYVEYTWQCIRGLGRGARAVFTQAPLPFKCPGAPQKIVYLCADHLRKQNLLESVDVSFFTAAPGMFGVPYYARELVKVAERYGVQTAFQHNLVAVDGPARQARFRVTGGEREGEEVTTEFDMLHVTPPQRAVAVVRESALANEAGFADVDQATLQHTRFSNVFALGDVGSMPNSKTAAAIRKQSPVVVQNLLALIDGRAMPASYDGYASCPLTTAYGKVLMAEFCYGGKVTPTFPLDPGVERRSYWWIKTTGLPLMYWHYMLRGHERFLEHSEWPAAAQPPA